MFPDLPRGGARRRRVGTIGEMSARRFTLKKLTAALLPLSFLWLCACCVFTCGQEAGAEAARLVVGSPVALFEVKGETGCEEDCPRAPDLKAAGTERATIKAGLRAATAAPPAAPADAPFSRTPFSRPRRQPPRAEPPLELLSTLRI